MAKGFAPRQAATVVYLPDGPQPHADLSARLGKHKASKGCLSLKNLADVDLLETLVRTALASAD